MTIEALTFRQYLIAKALGGMAAQGGTGKTTAQAAIELADDVIALLEEETRKKDDPAARKAVFDATKKMPGPRM